MNHLRAAVSVHIVQDDAKDFLDDYFMELNTCVIIEEINNHPTANSKVLRIFNYMDIFR